MSLTRPATLGSGLQDDVCFRVKADPVTCSSSASPCSNPLLNMLPTIVNDLSYVETVIEVAKLGGPPTESASAAGSK